MNYKQHYVFIVIRINGNAVHLSVYHTHRETEGTSEIHHVTNHQSNSSSSYTTSL